MTYHLSTSTSHPGQLSLLSSVGREMSTSRRAGSKGRCGTVNLCMQVLVAGTTVWSLVNTWRTWAHHRWLVIEIHFHFTCLYSTQQPLTNLPLANVSGIDQLLACGQNACQPDMSAFCTDGMRWCLCSNDNINWMPSSLRWALDIYTDRQTDHTTHNIIINRQTDTQTHRPHYSQYHHQQTDRHTDRQTDHTTHNIIINRQTDTQTHRPHYSQYHHHHQSVHYTPNATQT